MHMEGWHLMALQETRLPPGTTGGHDSGCFLISSGASGGHFGCGLMVSTATAYATSRAGPRHLQRSHFHMLSANPRYMFVRVDAPFLQEIIAIAHCPYQSTNGPLETARKEWWAAFRKQCRRWKPTIVVGDFNAHITPLM